jgi:hypothetical protein
MIPFSFPKVNRETLRVLLPDQRTAKVGRGQTSIQFFDELLDLVLTDS